MKLILLSGLFLAINLFATITPYSPVKIKTKSALLHDKSQSPATFGAEPITAQTEDNGGESPSQTADPSQADAKVETAGKVMEAEMAAPPRAKRYTLFGYIKNVDGEPLINASVYAPALSRGTLTNSYGFFSLSLPEGEHQIRISYVGYEEVTRMVNLTSNQTVTAFLTSNTLIDEVVIFGNLNSPLHNTQTGKRTFSQHDIRSEFSFLSTPDVVKTLKRTSGVAEGIELMSGLYVHGGNNDENLYLLDGTPMYQVNHTFGIFSSFNSDVIKNVDFYKSGFPARYGGRLSSVIDVRTNDGTMNQVKGMFRLGLIDGALQLEGPIQKNKTSFNIGIRRSWIDLISKPIFSMINKDDNEDDFTMDFMFQDINAKLTHLFNDRSRISLSVYVGEDKMSTDEKLYWKLTDEQYDYHDQMKNNFDWGNFNAALNWSYMFSPKLFANFSAVYSFNRSKFYSTYVSDISDNPEDNLYGLDNADHGFTSSINDVGYRAEFDFRPNPSQHIRFGHTYTHHLIKPQTSYKINYYSDQNKVDTVSSESSNRHLANEYVIFAEDEINFNNALSVNGGFNMHVFTTKGKSFWGIDPRLAFKVQATENLTFKMSYTKMSQFMHKISNSFLEMPTDYWAATTERLQPMTSDQFAIGMYYNINKNWFMSIEASHKITNHLLQYANWNGLEPPAESWDTSVMDGKGKYFGIEVDAKYHAQIATIDMSYTLSFNQRKFEELYEDWFYDVFDNRHKFNFTARFKFNPKIHGYVSWMYHSGNRMTLPTQYVQMPDTPSSNNIDLLGESNYVYDKPNNIVLSPYHRMDAGFDFRHKTKRGNERVWNLSVYNLYCHLNTMWVTIRQPDKPDYFKAKTHGYIPIIPSCSYTLYF